MAYTSIHPIKATVQKSIDYITDNKKTDDKLYVSSFACSAATAEYDFKGSLSRTGSVNVNQAYHLIQAFAPGEVSYDEAHKIGEELADRLLGGKYSYVLSTHVEKDHVHNHLIFCAADNFEHKKFNDCKQTLRDIRSISDRLCAEHGLSTIRPANNKSLKYNKWMESKGIPTLREQLMSDIRKCIKLSSDYESFLELMKAKGYEIKGHEFGKDAAKYIAFKPLGSSSFIRGSERTLWKGYTKEDIREKIESKTARKVGEQSAKSPSSDRLIDTSHEKYESSPGLKRWADLQNLKLAATTYADAGTLAHLNEKIGEKNTVIKETYKSISSLNKDIKLMTEAIVYAQELADNKPYHDRYLKEKDPDAWLMKGDNEMHYILYTGAERFLTKNGFDPAYISPSKLKEKLTLMKQQRSTLEASLHAAESDVKSLEQERSLLQEYLAKDYSQDVEKPKEKDKDRAI